MLGVDTQVYKDMKCLLGWNKKENELQFPQKLYAPDTDWEPHRHLTTIIILVMSVLSHDSLHNSNRLSAQLFWFVCQNNNCLVVWPNESHFMLGTISWTAVAMKVDEFVIALFFLLMNSK